LSEIFDISAFFDLFELVFYVHVVEEFLDLEIEAFALLV
jgi:hypothetical protein